MKELKSEKGAPGFYNLARLKNRRKRNSQKKHTWDKDKKVQAGH